MADLTAERRIGSASTEDRGRFNDEHLLFLTDERLRQGIELLFFAYRSFVSDPDRILDEYGLGRAHHRALHFIGRFPDIPVAKLLAILGVTKQSLNRVLTDLIHLDIVAKRKGDEDQRQRLLSLTERGIMLERRLAEVQRARVRRAYREAGADAVAGFRVVLEKLIEEQDREEILRLVLGVGEK